MLPIPLEPDTLLRYVEVGAADCWEWQGGRTRDGYGRISFGVNSGRSAHRTIYQMLVGQIDAELELDHLCRNRICVNPDHLEPVTRAENARRSPLVSKSHCKRGHPLTGRNRISGASGTGCRACHYEAKNRRARERRRAARQSVEATA